jgi:hypothetical protein
LNLSGEIMMQVIPGTLPAKKSSCFYRGREKKRLHAAELLHKIDGNMLVQK